MENENCRITSQALVRGLGISRQLAHHWVKHGVPVLRVPEVERALGIPRSKIRPDYWPASDDPGDHDA